MSIDQILASPLGQSAFGLLLAFIAFMYWLHYRDVTKPKAKKELENQDKIANAIVRTSIAIESIDKTTQSQNETNTEIRKFMESTENRLEAVESELGQIKKRLPLEGGN